MHKKEDKIITYKRKELNKINTKTRRRIDIVYHKNIKLLMKEKCISINPLVH